MRTMKKIGLIMAIGAFLFGTIGCSQLNDKAGSNTNPQDVSDLTARATEEYNKVVLNWKSPSSGNGEKGIVISWQDKDGIDFSKSLPLNSDSFATSINDVTLFLVQVEGESKNSDGKRVAVAPNLPNEAIANIIQERIDSLEKYQFAYNLTGDPALLSKISDLTNEASLLLDVYDGYDKSDLQDLITEAKKEADGVLDAPKVTLTSSLTPEQLSYVLANNPNIDTLDVDGITDDATLDVLNEYYKNNPDVEIKLSGYTDLTVFDGKDDMKNAVVKSYGLLNFDIPKSTSIGPNGVVSYASIISNNGRIFPYEEDYLDAGYTIFTRDSKTHLISLDNYKPYDWGLGLGETYMSEFALCFEGRNVINDMDNVIELTVEVVTDDIEDSIDYGNYFNTFYKVQPAGVAQVKSYGGSYTPWGSTNNGVAGSLAIFSEPTIIRSEDIPGGKRHVIQLVPDANNELYVFEDKTNYSKDALNGDIVGYTIVFTPSTKDKPSKFTVTDVVIGGQSVWFPLDAQE